VKLLRSGLVVTLLALVCSMGLVIQTARPAEALDPGDIGKLGKNALKLGATIVEDVPGGANTIKGVSLFGRFSNPVGWAITGGMAAWWAYDNRDSIMDFIGGTDTPSTRDEWSQSQNWPQTGTGTGTSGAWTPHGVSSKIDLTILGVGTAPNSIKVRMECKWATSSYSCQDGNGKFARIASLEIGGDPSAGRAPDYALREFANCKTGTAAPAQARPTASVNYVGDTYGTVRTIDIPVCPTGSTVTGIAIAPRIASGIDPQTFGLAWGDLLPVDGTKPITFDGAKVTIDCRNAATGDTATLTSRSDLGASGTVVMPSCKQHLGDDWYGTGFKVAPTLPKVDDEPIEVPDFPPLEWDELIPKEDAQPCHGTKNGCSLSVWVDNDPCSEGVSKCKTWTKIATKTPDRVECQYGARTVPIKNCYPLAHAYDTRTGQNTNTQTGPDTSAPPKTGTQTPTQTETDAPATPKPDAGTSNPAPPAEAADKPEQGKCFPKGWGMLNPFEWVYKPVKCVMVWAFVPPTAFDVRLTRMKAKFDNKAPFSWVMSLTSLPSAIPGGGCPDWTLKPPKGASRNIICGTPFGNAMRGARPVLAALMIGAACWPLIRSVMYASFPVVKTSATSS
jgi:hypothetical protein